MALVVQYPPDYNYMYYVRRTKNEKFSKKKMSSHFPILIYNQILLSFISKLTDASNHNYIVIQYNDEHKKPYVCNSKYLNTVLARLLLVLYAYN